MDTDKQIIAKMLLVADQMRCVPPHGPRGAELSWLHLGLLFFVSLSLSLRFPDLSVHRCEVQSPDFTHARDEHLEKPASPRL